MFWCHTAVIYQCVKVVLSYSSDTPVCSCYDVIQQWYPSVFMLWGHRTNWTLPGIFWTGCNGIRLRLWDTPSAYGSWPRTGQTYLRNATTWSYEVMWGPELVKLIWGTQPHGHIVIWSHLRHRSNVEQIWQMLWSPKHIVLFNSGQWSPLCLFKAVNWQHVKVRALKAFTGEINTISGSWEANVCFKLHFSHFHISTSYQHLFFFTFLSLFCSLLWVWKPK